jgi:hypothetical protein
MKTIGTITKTESLIPIDYNVLKHTCVLEANQPYADYYGLTPSESKTHSIFLITNCFYSLDEIIDVTKGIKVCFSKHEYLDVASAVIDFKNHYNYAIRVRDFPEYKHIHWLQSCYISKGVSFTKKIENINPAKITVCKQFNVTEYKEGIYLDKNNRSKGYITIPEHITETDFSEFLVYVRNNKSCELFDAAMGTMEINSDATEILRIYAENLTPGLLLCIKKTFAKLVENKQLIQS